MGVQLARTDVLQCVQASPGVFVGRSRFSSGLNDAQHSAVPQFAQHGMLSRVLTTSPSCRTMITLIIDRRIPAHDITQDYPKQGVWQSLSG